MIYEWGEAKRQANIISHGVDFATAVDFDWSTALETRDDRNNYGEERFIVLGAINSRLHVMIYTMRDDNIRIISLRKANQREVKYYEKA